MVSGSGLWGWVVGGVYESSVGVWCVIGVWLWGGVDVWLVWSVVGGGLGSDVVLCGLFVGCGLLVTAWWVFGCWFVFVLGGCVWWACVLVCCFFFG